jgi:histidyl-tRNA synthetase
MTDLAGGPCPEAARLETIMAFAVDCGAAGSFVLDPSITRGLDYYTGVVFETFLDSDPAIGSVCSGGRYGDLAGLYTKNQVSGVGASVGLDRLIAALENSGRLPPVTGSAALAVACLKEEDSGLYQVLADRLRALGVSCEVFVQAGENPVKQFVLAEKRGIKWVLLPGERPLEDAFTLRNLAGRKNTEGLCVAEAAKLVLGE